MTALKVVRSVGVAAAYRAFSTHVIEDEATM